MGIFRIEVFMTIVIYNIDYVIYRAKLTIIVCVYLLVQSITVCSIVGFVLSICLVDLCVV